MLDLVYFRFLSLLHFFSSSLFITLKVFCFSLPTVFPFLSHLALYFDRQLLLIWVS